VTNRLLGLIAFATVFALWPTSDAKAIPAFARAYNVPCASCHSAITRRHEFGDVFRKGGFRWPMMAEGASSELEIVELTGIGALDAWLPRTVPISVEGTFAASMSTDDTTEPVVIGSPSLTLLSGAAFGEHVSLFGRWSTSGPAAELYLHLARLGGLPEVNLRAGYFEQTTTQFRPNENLMGSYLHGTSPISGFIPSAPRGGIEANGVLRFLGSRTFYAGGLVQNADLGSNMDGYFRLEQKIGGISLLGEEPEIDLMADESFWDSVYATVGGWGYFGRVGDLLGTNTHQIRRFALEANLYVHGFTLQGAVMMGFDEELMANRDVTSISWFLEAQYPLLSWLSLVYIYQYQDSNDLERERQQHDAGILALITENVRTRLKFSFSDDGVDNDIVELQFLAAL